MPVTARSISTALSGIIVTTALVFAVQTPSQGQASKDRDVRVINTSSEPVPSAIVGTPTVNIGNSPAVTIASLPSVTIGGTPTVALAPGANAVVVENTALSPAMVRDADAALRTPYKKSYAGLFSVGDPHAFMTTLTVPAGKRFVLEGISGAAQLPAGQKVTLRLQLDDDGFDQDATFVMPMMHQGLFSSGESYAGSEHIKLVLSASGQIIVHAFRDSASGSGYFEVMVAGYFEDVP
jgi:hypothetical protein